MKKLLVALLGVSTLSVMAGAAPQPSSIGDAAANTIVFPPTTYTNLFATSTVLPSSTYMIIVTSGGFPGDQTFKGTPFLSTTTILGVQAGGTVPISSGTLVMLTGNTTNQLTLQDAGLQTNSGMNLLLPTAVLSSTRTISLIFDGARWEQLRGGNQQ